MESSADDDAADRTDRKPTAPIETQTTVLDLQGVGLMGFWKVKQTMQLVVQIGNVRKSCSWKTRSGSQSRLTFFRLVSSQKDYYPESSHRIVFINAPYVFATIWSYVKGIIHPRTAARVSASNERGRPALLVLIVIRQVSILGADYEDQLREQISEANLPKQYGGNCTCEGVPGGCRNGDVGIWNDNKGVPHL